MREELWLCIRLPQFAREAIAGTGLAAEEDAAGGSQAQREALERLAAWAYQWSSRISYTPCEPLLWLELGASAALFGGQQALRTRIEAGLSELGYSHVCALAPSASAAALLTYADEPRCVLTKLQLRQRLDALPLALLELSAATRSALETSGLRRIGQVLELPAAAITRRFGPETQLYLRRLCAHASDPRAAWRVPDIYRTRCEFGGEVRTTTALLFPLQRMLLEFQGYLRARDCSVQRFTLEFEHYRQPPSSLTIGLSAPGRDAPQLLALARERLHSLVLCAPVSALRLQALEFTSPQIVQGDLFGSDAQPLQQMQRLLDRLRARLGETSIHGLQLLADYRPERGSRPSAPMLPSTTSNPRPSSPEDDAPPRPCWLLPEPQRIEAPVGPLLRGPERIESGWWDGGDVRRDYYSACNGEGAQLWLFRDRRDGGWYLQGLWA
jgi:protein ImuB